MKDKSILLLLFIASLTGRISAQDCAQQTSLNAWLNFRLTGISTELAKAEVDRSNPSKAPRASRLSRNFASFIDTPRGSDYVGVEAELAALTFDSDDPEPNALSIDINPYFFKSLFSHALAYDPVYYNKNRKIRDVSFNISVAEAKGQPTEWDFQAKTILFSGRDPNDPQNEALVKNINETLKMEGKVTLDAVDAVESYLYKRLAERNVLPDEVSRSTEGPRIGFEKYVNTQFGTVCRMLTDDERKHIDEILSFFQRKLPDYEKVLGETQAALESKPEISVSFLTARRTQNAPSDYFAGIEFEKGLMFGLSADMNAGYKFVDDREENLSGADAGIGVGRDIAPGSIKAGLEAEWLTHVSPWYRANLTFEYSPKEGLTVPFALVLVHPTEKQRNDIRFLIDIVIDPLRLKEEISR